jgi:ApaG protein
MAKEITENISIEVKSRFEPTHSEPEKGHHLFSYEITIKNLSESRVQLLKRKWFINDLCGHKKIVEGDGVIGEQPVLDSGESHTYTSFCDLISGMGNMRGYYVFLRYSDLKEFKVNIPEFSLNVPWVLN